MEYLAEYGAMSALCVGTCSLSVKDITRHVMSSTTVTCSVTWPVLGCDPCGLTRLPLSGVLCGLAICTPGRPATTLEGGGSP